MTKKMNYSQLEFVHEPNNLVTFLNTQCRLRDEKYIVPWSEQKFLDEVMFSDKVVVERNRGRQTGGTTILGFMALYFALHDLKVLYVTKDSNVLHSIITLFRNTISVHPHKLSFTSRDKMHIDYLGVKRTVNFKLDTVRGASADIVIADTFGHRTLGKRQQFIKENIPAIKPNGKFIINDL